MVNYIETMRRFIGHETLMTVGCGVIIEHNGQILLQHRTDDDTWCIPGGLMEIGETFAEAASREVFEETDLIVNHLELFGLYSGEQNVFEYPNRDRVFSVQVIFKTASYSGELRQEGMETKEHRFFSRDNLPFNLTTRQKPFIIDWKEGKATPVLR
ncbi:NUDIX domain-containing protein [Priestia koreensis]|nr:NUDIX domain-containing protein [Priestia koreensis]MCM3005168.1 NUDIX domain-containing protein [Priestia koreensis]